MTKQNPPLTLTPVPAGESTSSDFHILEGPWADTFIFATKCFQKRVRLVNGDTAMIEAIGIFDAGIMLKTDTVGWLKPEGVSEVITPESILELKLEKWFDSLLGPNVLPVGSASLLVEFLASLNITPPADLTQ